MLLHLIRFDLRQTLRRPGELALPPLFFLLLLASHGLLSRGTPSPSLFWLAVLLSLFLPSQRVFADDRRDGTLDWMVLRASAGVVFWAKVLGHWLAHGLPFLLLLPLWGVLFPLGLADAVALVLLSLYLSLLLVTGAALLLGSGGGGMLLYLVLLPLALPGVIFATATGETEGGSLWLLAGVTAFAAAVLPWAGGSALKQATHE